MTYKALLFVPVLVALVTMIGFSFVYTKQRGNEKMTNQISLALITVTIGLLIIVVPLETNAQSDQNITKILKPNATLTAQQKTAIVLRLLMPSNVTHIVLTPQQKIIVCKSVIQGIENYTTSTPDSMVKSIVEYLWWHVYNKSCTNVTGHRVE